MLSKHYYSGSLSGSDEPNTRFGALSGADIYFHRLLKYFSLSSLAPMVVAEDMSRNFFSLCLRYRLSVFQLLWVLYFATSASVQTARGSHCMEITTPFKFQRDNSDIALTNRYEFKVLYELADNGSRQATHTTCLRESVSRIRSVARLPSGSIQLPLPRPHPPPD